MEEFCEGELQAENFYEASNYHETLKHKAGVRLKDKTEISYSNEKKTIKQTDETTECLNTFGLFAEIGAGFISQIVSSEAARVKRSNRLQYRQTSITGRIPPS